MPPVAVRVCASNAASSPLSCPLRWSQDEDSDLSFAIRKADLVFTILFTLEMLLKWVGLGLCKYRHSYFRDAWNWLDFIIVVEGIVSTFTAGSGVNFQGLRTFRVLRPLRTITHLEGLRVVVNALLLSLPLLVNTLLVCVFYFLIFGIVCVQVRYAVARCGAGLCARA